MEKTVSKIKMGFNTQSQSPLHLEASKSTFIIGEGDLVGCSGDCYALASLYISGFEWSTWNTT